MENNFIKLTCGYTADIYYNQQINVIKKTLLKFKDYDILQRESFVLKYLQEKNYNWSPRLLNVDLTTYSLYMEHVGEPINSSNAPKNWKEQLQSILNDLETEGIQHNDINVQNILVKNDKIYLIDFGWASLKNDWSFNNLFSPKQKPMNIYNDKDCFERLKGICYTPKPADITVAVMTRIQYIESPYLNEFILWYKKLGFSKILFLNTEPKNEKYILEFIDSELLDFIKIYDHGSVSVNSFGNVKNILKKETFDYILHVDSDEYLMLPSAYTTISAYIKQHTFEKYKFYWLNVAIDEYYCHCIRDYLLSDKATGRFCGAHKMMVNRQTWLNDSKSKMDPHSFYCTGKTLTASDSKLNGTKPYIIHVLVRGYWHTILKTLCQRLPTNKSDCHAKTMKFLNSLKPAYNLYPNRVLLASTEYAIQKRSLIEFASTNWRIPDIQLTPVPQPRLLQLFADNLKIVLTGNLLENDIYNLEEKFTVLKKYIVSLEKIKQLEKLNPSEIIFKVKKML